MTWSDAIQWQLVYPVMVLRLLVDGLVQWPLFVSRSGLSAAGREAIDAHWRRLEELREKALEWRDVTGALSAERAG